MMNLIFSLRYRIFACFAFIGIMILVRICFSGSERFLFLVWNIFLAWIPYSCSLFFRRFYQKEQRIKLLFFMTAWLCFFPNSLYVMTDLIHLRQSDNIPVWYDAVLLFLAAFTGLVLAFASLLNAERSLKKMIPEKYISFSIVLLLFAGSFGVYIGRFLRWNSWSILTHPLSLVNDIVQRIIHPLMYLRTWGICFFLTALYCFVWYLIKATMSYLPEKTKV